MVTNDEFFKGTKFFVTGLTESYFYIFFHRVVIVLNVKKTKGTKFFVTIKLIFYNWVIIIQSINDKGTKFFTVKLKKIKNLKNKI